MILYLSGMFYTENLGLIHFEPNCTQLRQTITMVYWECQGFFTTKMTQSIDMVSDFS